jgi:DNA uptake protein ComE-like DNA-binding protein
MLGVISLALVACGDTVPTATLPAATAQATAAPESTSTPEPAATSTSISRSDSSGEPTSTATTMPTPGEAAVTKLNLNEVTEAELMSTIPNFSARMVREFQEYRPYSSIQQFRREIGKYVDQSQVTEWEQYVYVPVDPNDSDAETLMQLPGVDETIASTLISARPYASNAAFLEELGKHVDASQTSRAESYLATK